MDIIQINPKLKKKKNHHCNNCNSYGHIYKNCEFPISSFGIICYKIENKQIKYLLIRRRNSFAFVDFIKGLKNNLNINYIQFLFEHMTIIEHKLLNDNKHNFDYIWEQLWSHNIEKHNWEKNACKEGFNNFDFDLFLTNFKPKYLEAEWGFSKGRRNNKEDDINTALREFNEETNIDIKDIEIIFNHCYEEIFKSYNNIIYKSTYFICKCNPNVNLSIDPSKSEQFCEIDSIKWMSYNEALKNIRDYYINKKKILEILHEKIKKIEKNEL